MRHSGSWQAVAAPVSLQFLFREIAKLNSSSLPKFCFLFHFTIVQILLLSRRSKINSRRKIMEALLLPRVWAKMFVKILFSFFAIIALQKNTKFSQQFCFCFLQKQHYENTKCLQKFSQKFLEKYRGKECKKCF